MTQHVTQDWSIGLADDDLRGLALILEYASEQARKLDLTETTDLITRAARSLDGRLSACLTKPRNEASAESGETAPGFADCELRAWQTPEFIGGPMIFDDVA